MYGLISYEYKNENANDDNNPFNDTKRIGNEQNTNSTGETGVPGNGGSAGYTYSAPAGGGGTTSSVQVGNTTVTFGHGGRHLEIGDISGVESAIANNVVARPSTTGKALIGYVSYGGVDFTYRYWTISSTHIHVGTYFYTVAK